VVGIKTRSRIDRSIDRAWPRPLAFPRRDARYRSTFLLRLGTVRCIFSDICGADAGIGAAPASGLHPAARAGAFPPPPLPILSYPLPPAPPDSSPAEFPPSAARALETIGSRGTGRENPRAGFLFAVMRSSARARARVRTVFVYLFAAEDNGSRRYGDDRERDSIGDLTRVYARRIDRSSDSDSRLVIRRLARRREKKIHYRREVIIALCLASIPP